MDQIPHTQLAIVGGEGGGLMLTDSAEVPELEEDMILVKNAAVALNPVDIKMIGPLATTGAVAGHDFAGTVVAVGSNIWTAAQIGIGDRVCGAVQVRRPVLAYSEKDKADWTICTSRECIHSRRKWEPTQNMSEHST
jgi:NADPH:quinone reductase-like Zn-dependent oxidoreductase